MCVGAAHRMDTEEDIEFRCGQQERLPAGGVIAALQLKLDFQGQGGSVKAEGRTDVMVGPRGVPGKRSREYSEGPVVFVRRVPQHTCIH